MVGASFETKGIKLKTHTILDVRSFNSVPSLIYSAIKHFLIHDEFIRYIIQKGFLIHILLLQHFSAMSFSV